ncbi:hypothetical protein JTB14_030961 [Gonioctena quinquepunctata]|nr:hypothetical protein JTB14_030961 [Gonioctena quinquepunctata]
MLKLLVLVIFANSIIGCKWVCVDEKNRIMKEYIESGQFKLDYQKHEISVRQNVKKKHNNMKTTRRPKYSSDVLPEVTLRMPEIIVEPSQEVTLRMPEIIVEPSQDICNSKEFRTSMKEMSKKVKCKPRETIVDIKYKGGRSRENKHQTVYGSVFWLQNLPISGKEKYIASRFCSRFEQQVPMFSCNGSPRY